jgi:hypothetical protein
MARLFAVLVGCNYEGSGRAELPVLEGAEHDARQMAALLAGQPIANGTLARLTLLLGAEATTANIEAALVTATTAQTGADSLLFYFAGHGQRDDAAGLILATWDADLPAGSLVAAFGPDPKPTALVLDCCHAGAIAGSAGVPAAQPIP